MAGRSAASASWDSWLLLLVLGRWLTTADFLEVEMAGRTQIVSLNDNVTIFCKIPGSPHLNIKIMGITWFRKSQMSEKEVKLFEFFGDHQVAFRPGAIVSPWRLEKGDASLQLPEVQLGEAGEYRCEVVVTPQKAQGRVWIEVVAYPASRLFLQQAMVKGNEDTHIVCKSSGFYPEAINITWEKWTQKVPHHLEISEGVVTNPATKNEDGTFNVTSYLNLQSSLEDSGTVYQCVVWHTSLLTPLRINFTQAVIGSKKRDALGIIFLPCVGLILLLIGLCFWKRHQILLYCSCWSGSTLAQSNNLEFLGSSDPSTSAS